MVPESLCPILSAPLAALFNQSIAVGVVPQQWKTAVITPVPKVPAPTSESDYRPISITPVLSRMIERRIVTTFIYPALDNPPPDLNFSDQYAFRPTESTTAAIVAILHTICSMLCTNSYVRVFAIDFSKAFDSIRHHKLLDKMSYIFPTKYLIGWRIFSAGVLTARDSAMSYLQLPPYPPVLCRDPA